MVQLHFRADPNSNYGPVFLRQTKAIYRFDIADLFGSDADYGDMQLRLAGTHLESLSVTPVPTGGADNELGELTTFLGRSAPENVINLDVTWNYNRWSTNYQYRNQSSVLYIEQADLANEPDTLFPFETEGIESHDISVSYEFNDNFDIYGGVQNFTKPSRQIGLIRDDRVFFLGANLKFDKISDLTKGF